ncbi:MAG TPA: triose-phosphate isomerase [Planctomycetota bacterium]|nr:triose-phosphate isomerase [Planctomycetota bacterium]
MRIPFIAGNWKMNKDLAAARALAQGVREALGAPAGVEVALCPAFPFLGTVGEVLAGSGIGLGAQNAYYEPEGAFTGEVSCEMLRSVGATHVILGHSERRKLFGEDDGLINMKLRAALATGLRPILCVGETLEEREANRTMAVVSQQLALGLDGLSSRELAAPLPPVAGTPGGLGPGAASAAAPLTIAYEPVWAIGTGRNATPAQAQEVHRFIRGFVRDRFNESVAAGLRIPYGGSVKAKNAAELLAEPDVDGALVGGASLDAKEFAAIVAAARKKTA